MQPRPRSLLRVTVTDDTSAATTTVAAWPDWAATLRNFDPFQDHTSGFDTLYFVGWLLANRDFG